jgi:hypothetical protein
MIEPTLTGDAGGTGTCGGGEALPLQQANRIRAQNQTLLRIWRSPFFTIRAVGPTRGLSRGGSQVEAAVGSSPS